MCGPKREEVAGGWRRLHNEELHNLYASPDIVRVSMSRNIRWTGRVGTESITKYTLTFGITRCCPLQRVMAAKLTRLTHKIAIQLHLVAESCTICSSRSTRPVRKLLDTPSYIQRKREREGDTHTHTHTHTIRSSAPRLPAAFSISVTARSSSEADICVCVTCLSAGTVPISRSVGNSAISF
jgi:hypothetical protein